MKRLLVFGIVLIASIFVTACAQATPEPVTYTIEMTEYAFTPNTIEAKVGQQVTIKLVNEGALEHEIMFGRDVMMVNNMPNGYQVDMFETGGVEPEAMMPEGSMSEMESGEHGAGHEGFMMVLPKNGDQASMKFTVTEEMVGEWEMGCFSLDGVHYTSGMVGKFTVLP